MQRIRKEFAKKMVIHKIKLWIRSQPIMVINDLAQIGSHNKKEKKTYIKILS